MAKKIVIKKVASIEDLGQITDLELTKLSEAYEPENYNPVENMNETLTIRFTTSEKIILTEYANRQGKKISQFVRETILNSLKNDDTRKEIHEIHSMLKKYVCTK
jgi:predicted HicB family RNase H-like nuclease